MSIKSIWLKNKINCLLKQSSVVWNATLWITSYTISHVPGREKGNWRLCLQLSPRTFSHFIPDLVTIIICNDGN